MRMINSYGSSKLTNNIQYFALITVPIVLFLIFFIYPVLSSISLSVFEWNGLSAAKKFVGLKNFIYLFTVDGVFLKALQNTLVFTITVTVFQNLIGLILSILICGNNSKINNAFRTIYFLPSIFSTVTVGFIWGLIYDPNFGLLNNLLNGIGLDFLSKAWLGDHGTVMYAIAGVQIWQSIGYSMVLFIAGLQNIPLELYEASMLEGASRWKQFLYITFPLLMPTTTIILMLSTIGCFKSFDYVYIMTGGGGDRSSEVLATMLFREGFEYSRVGYSCAVSTVLLIIVAVVSITQRRILKGKS